MITTLTQSLKYTEDLFINSINISGNYLNAATRKDFERSRERTNGPVEIPLLQRHRR